LNTLPVTVDDSQDFELIRNRFRIDDDRFKLGMKFASLIVDGVSSKRAYEETFQVDKEKAISNASSFHRAKWIQELIRYIRPNDETLYIGEVKTIIQRGMEIIRDRRSSPREVTEAMKALQPYIKQEQLKIDVQMDKETSDGLTTIANVMQGINSLSLNNKMVGKSGEIVDVELMDWLWK